MEIQLQVRDKMLLLVSLLILAKGCIFAMIRLDFRLNI